MSQYSVTTVLNQIFYHTFPYVGRAHGRGRGGPASLHVGLFILSVKGTDGGWGRGRGRDQAQGGDLEARQLGTGKRFVAFTQPALILHCRCENLYLCESWALWLRWMAIVHRTGKLPPSLRFSCCVVLFSFATLQGSNTGSESVSGSSIHLHAI